MLLRFTLISNLTATTQINASEKKRVGVGSIRYIHTYMLAEVNQFSWDLSKNLKWPLPFKNHLRSYTVGRYIRMLSWTQGKCNSPAAGHFH